MKQFGKFGGMELIPKPGIGTEFNMDVPLYPYVAKALGNRSVAYPIIDKCFSINKYSYYRAAVDNIFYRHPIITDGCLLQVEYARKVLGILIFFVESEQTNKTTNSYQSIIKIIKKAYPFMYQYLLNNNKFNPDAYAIALRKKRRNNMENINTDELVHSFIVAMYLSNLDNKPLTKGYQHIIQFSRGRLNFFSLLLSNYILKDF